VANRDGAVEFLYRILRGDHEASRRSAAVMLYKLEDDYAPQVLADLLSAGPGEVALDILRRVRGALREALLPPLGALLPSAAPAVHQALRELLVAAEGIALRQKIVAMILGLRAGASEDEEDLPIAVDGGTVALHSERTAFQFERENMQDLVMFFTDIKGYSKKAQILTPLQLTNLLQEYEKILLAHVEGHAGELVKRMGDGHMIVFQRPLDAVLAAIRLQKSLRRFNRYRDENTQVVIRIGIHSGQVVRKSGGDVLGNAVNIASRLESSAQPGSVLVSDRIYDAVKDHVHAREIGAITVKNITGAIKVFEPYEIVIDLPAQLDPLKGARAPLSTEQRPAAGGQRAGAAAGPETAALAEAARCLSALAALCRAAPAGGTVPVSAINDQVLTRWSRARAAYSATTAAATPAKEKQ
jgi:class 3 adenylate cyclase